MFFDLLRRTLDEMPSSAPVSLLLLFNISCFFLSLRPPPADGLCDLKNCPDACGCGCDPPPIPGIHSCTALAPMPESCNLTSECVFCQCIDNTARLH